MADTKISALTAVTVPAPATDQIAVVQAGTSKRATPSQYLPGAMWQMKKNSTPQTLTASTDNTITFEAAGVDSGGSVIDLANDRFVAPADGLYLAVLAWHWESTAPGSYEMSVRVGGAHVWTMARAQATATANGVRSEVFPMQLTAGQFVTAVINPGTPTGVTARGNAAINLATNITLIRLL